MDLNRLLSFLYKFRERNDYIANEWIKLFVSLVQWLAL